jgi:hypothetical protein
MTHEGMTRMEDIVTVSSEWMTREGMTRMEDIVTVLTE